MTYRGRHFPDLPVPTLYKGNREPSGRDIGTKPDRGNSVIRNGRRDDTALRGKGHFLFNLNSGTDPRERFVIRDPFNLRKVLAFVIFLVKKNMG